MPGPLYWHHIQGTGKVEERRGAHFRGGAVRRSVRALGPQRQQCRRERRDISLRVGTLRPGLWIRHVAGSNRCRATTQIPTVSLVLGSAEDSTMEQLANRGNGNYAYIDDLLEARRVLVEQMGATLLTIAKDVKLQVEFNPARVKAYRLIGYENRRLRDEEFNDDRKDAGDLGAGHSVTALYEVVPAGSEEPLPGVDPLKYQRTTLRPGASGTNEVLTVKLRYKPPKGAASRLLTRVLTRPEDGAAPSRAFRFAAAVADFGLLLRDSPYKGAADYDHAFEEVRQTLGSDGDGHRSELLSLVRTGKELVAAAAVTQAEAR